MKNELMIFVIGLLLGAVIATGAFYVYSTTTSNSNSNNNTQMTGGQPPEMPSGQSGENGQPPEKPGENTNTQENTNE